MRTKQTRVVAEVFKVDQAALIDALLPEAKAAVERDLKIARKEARVATQLLKRLVQDFADTCPMLNALHSVGVKGKLTLGTCGKHLQITAGSNAWQHESYPQVSIALKYPQTIANARLAQQAADQKVVNLEYLARDTGVLRQRVKTQIRDRLVREALGSRRDFKKAAKMLFEGLTT